MSIYTNDLTEIVDLVDHLGGKNVTGGTLRTGEGHLIEFSLDGESGEQLVIDALNV